MNSDQHQPLQFPVDEVHWRNLLRSKLGPEHATPKALAVIDSFAAEIAKLKASMTYGTSYSLPTTLSPEETADVAAEIQKVMEGYRDHIIEEAAMPMIERLLKAEGKWI